MTPGARVQEGSSDDQEQSLNRCRRTVRHLGVYRWTYRSRAGRGGPSLIEAKTYRHGGHSRADPGKYRPDEEVAEWMKKDPLPTYRERLLGLGLEEASLQVIESETEALVDEATETARNSNPPPVDIAHIDVWADGSATWRN